ncbi:alpha,alpha-trehalase TreF [Candidatus Saccharibacteria bacterium]|nr:alpha,alpha-trehalase TreF [Candidatus Saccharibacteria bacterium]
MLEKKIKAGITNITGLIPAEKAPDELLGELFSDVQLRRIHSDGKTFVDLVSERRLRQIAKSYRKAKLQPGFDLHKFVEEHFKGYTFDAGSYQASADRPAKEHIEKLWPMLTRQTYRPRGSLMPLPYPYVVPGGRFLEQFYWDTYFIMIGLAAGGHYEMIDDMMKNYAYMIRKIGYIPTANRTYFLTRSQPPFFAQMVRLLAAAKGRRVYVQYLPYMLAEYRFWMKGIKDVRAGAHAVNRVVRMPDGSILNRYYDKKQTPRPESYKEDVETAMRAEGRTPSQVYLDLRAGAESGWDFSSRWFRDPQDISTIHTTDIIPVDLNSLLYGLEQTIATAYGILKQSLLARRFERKAAARAEALQRYCWNDARGYYYDYDFVAGQQTDAETLAGVFPLFFRMPSSSQAVRVADKLEADFLKPGGLATTLAHTPQQWDSPNGWAPLQYIAIAGLRNYGLNQLANEVKERWLDACNTVYNAESKFVEKYNVYEPHNLGGGGEYELQDGFGWTNGVYMALSLDKEQ